MPDPEKAMSLFKFITENAGRLQLGDYACLTIATAAIAYCLFKGGSWLYAEVLRSKDEVIKSKEAVIDTYREGLSALAGQADRLKAEQAELVRNLTQLQEQYKKVENDRSRLDGFARELFRALLAHRNALLLSQHALAATRAIATTQIAVVSVLGAHVDAQKRLPHGLPLHWLHALERALDGTDPAALPPDKVLPLRGDNLPAVVSNLETLRSVKHAEIMVELKGVWQALDQHQPSNVGPRPDDDSGPPSEGEQK
jgi:hypothetical protein